MASGCHGHASVSFAAGRFEMTWLFARRDDQRLDDAKVPVGLRSCSRGHRERRCRTPTSASRPDTGPPATSGAARSLPHRGPRVVGLEGR